MATDANSTTERACRYCQSAMITSTEPSGASCLECVGCGHTVELSTINESTIEAASLPPVDALLATAAELADDAIAGSDRAALNATNKAAANLHKGLLPIRTVDGFLFTSATRSGTVHRFSTRYHLCSCEAALNGRDCWHAAMVRIVEATEMRRLVTTTVKPRYRVTAAQHRAAVEAYAAQLAA